MPCLTESGVLQPTRDVVRIGEGLDRARQVAVGVGIAAERSGERREDTRVRPIDRARHGAFRRMELEDDHAPGRPKDAADLPQRDVQLRDVPDGERGRGAMEGLVGERDRLDAREDAVEPRRDPERGRALRRDREHHRGDVDAGHARTRGRRAQDAEREVSGADADVERPLARAEPGLRDGAPAPGGERAERAGVGPAPLGAFAQALSVVLVLVGIQLVTAFLPARGLRSAAGLLAILAGAATLGIAAIARPSQSPYDVFALVALPLGALALGGSDGAMLLGHWYLVTPKLSPAPLQRAALVVVAAVALQLALVTITAFRGDLTGSWETALTVALAIRIGVGLLMTLAVAAAAWWTARMNTQSSTGLLYVALGCVFAGEVSARVIFFLTGVPV